MNRTLIRVLLAAGVAGGLIAGGGVAWAWWAASGTAPGPPPLDSGSIDLTVTGPSGSLTGPGGSVTLPALTITDATPGASDSEVFTVHNSATTPFIPSASAAGQGTAGPYLVPTVRWGGTDAGNTCTGGSTTGPALAPGEQVTVCVAVALAPDAPTSAQLTTGSMIFTLSAAQVPR
jgi:hypothetical protein